MVGAAVRAHLLRQHWAERTARHVSIEEVAEAVAALVLAGGVVGVGQAAHVDDAQLLPQRLAGDGDARRGAAGEHDDAVLLDHPRSEEHTSELQSLMRNSYAVFCLKKKKNQYRQAHH